ncbi:hypothetical protein VPH35_089152 [Triticum aestivum]|uniref:F-box domain-containing protein n=1 Tax=Triticum turgidum subsp. durum TaxID=4567 RepID=A0A9R0X423_TRITD|nr:unnamed protein product [Triticum turgidum subsp. durum]
MAGTRVEETTRGCSPACDHDGGIETVIDDLPADVLAIVLRCLDGASLAAAGCASAGFRELANDPDAWRALCLQMWPSLRQVVSCGGGGGYRALYADAFPFPAASPAVSSSLPARLVSAVDLHHNGVSIMSRVVETDASSTWFLGSPFRVDALVQEGFTSPSPVTPGDLRLSWILIDPATGAAVNVSSRRPVSIERRWVTGDSVARFTVVLGGGYVRRTARAYQGNKPVRGGRRGWRRERAGRASRGGRGHGQREAAPWSGGSIEATLREVRQGEAGKEGTEGEAGGHR